jgi:hypothetical protein
MSQEQKPSARNEKRPAEAGRQAGDAIPGGAGGKTPAKLPSSQEKKQNSPPVASRVIAYIDGFNLYFGMKSKGWKRYYWLDLPALCGQLLKPGQNLEATKYFTSRVSPTRHDPDQGIRQNTYLEALETHSGTRAVLGHYLPKSVVCRQCGSSWQTFEEKRTDVNIAIEMLADAHADRFDTALLISADSDLSAPIEKIRSLFPSKRVIAAFPPDRHSGQLARLVHGSFTIGEAKLRKSQLPDLVVKSNGFALARPKRWA